MTEDEYNEFLSGLGKCKSLDERKHFAHDFYDEMVKKYGNQFQRNGFIDELIDTLTSLNMEDAEKKEISN